MSSTTVQSSAGPSTVSRADAGPASRSLQDQTPAAVAAGSASRAGDDPVAAVEAGLASRSSSFRARARARRRHRAGDRCVPLPSPAMQAELGVVPLLMNIGSDKPIRGSRSLVGDEAHPPAVVVNVDPPVQPLVEPQKRLLREVVPASVRWVPLPRTTGTLGHRLAVGATPSGRRGLNISAPTIVGRFGPQVGEGKMRWVDSSGSHTTSSPSKAGRSR